MQIISFEDFKKRVYGNWKNDFRVVAEINKEDKKFSDKDNQNLVDNLISEKFLYDQYYSGSYILIFYIQLCNSRYLKENLFRLRIERMMSALVFQGHCVTYIDKCIKDRH